MEFLGDRGATDPLLAQSEETRLLPMWRGKPMVREARGGAALSLAPRLMEARASAGSLLVRLGRPREGLALRDVSTRLMPGTTPSTRIAFYGMTTLVVAGSVHMALIAPPRMPDAATFAYVAGTIGFGAFGYYLMIQAMRIGEISVVAPFRYTRVLFAMALAWLVFSRRRRGPGR